MHHASDHSMPLPVYSCHNRWSETVPERKAPGPKLHEIGHRVWVVWGPRLRVPIRSLPVQGAHGAAPARRNGRCGCFAVGARQQGGADLPVGARPGPRMEEGGPSRSRNGTQREIANRAGAEPGETLCMPGLRLLCTVVCGLEGAGGFERTHDGGDGMREPDMRRAMPEISFCGAPVEARGGSNTGVVRCRGAAEDATGSEEGNVGRARGHARCAENCEDDAPVHVNKSVKYETGEKILRKSRRKGNGRNGRNDQSPASVAKPDILLPDTIPAARPARKPPGSTMLDHVAPRPRPPPEGDAEG